MYIKVVNDTPASYTLNRLREDYPNVSFPNEISEEILETYNVFKVVQTSAPSIDTKTHRVTQNIEFVNNKWTQVWQIKELSQISAEENIRSHRNNLINGTDWIVTYHTEKGTPIPQEWLDYRQALRDVTLQEGFPFDVVWPTIPE